MVQIPESQRFVALNSCPTCGGKGTATVNSELVGVPGVYSTPYGYEGLPKLLYRRPWQQRSVPEASGDIQHMKDLHSIYVHDVDCEILIERQILL